MKFVKSITNEWHIGSSEHGVKVTNDGYYFFPYFISDDYRYSFECKGNLSDWRSTFKEVDIKEFVLNTNIPVETIEFIESLFKEISVSLHIDNINLFRRHSHTIMIIEILKQYNYGGNRIEKEKIISNESLFG